MTATSNKSGEAESPLTAPSAAPPKSLEPQQKREMITRDQVSLIDAIDDTARIVGVVLGGVEIIAELPP